MRGLTPPAATVRATAITLALLVHAMALLLLLLEGRAPGRRTAAQLQFISFWPLQPWPDVEPAARLPPPTAGERSRPASSMDSPAEAVAAPRVETDVPAPPAPESPSRQGEASIDWHAQAAEVAARHAEKDGRPDTFSPPPETLREPCKPRDSSFERGRDEKRAGLLPLPYVRVGKRCIVGLGFFACNLGELPKPNTHLFDDMQQGKTPDSSVPDPDFCD